MHPHHPPSSSSSAATASSTSTARTTSRNRTNGSPMPGALEAVARLNHAGWHVVVATNQAGIGRGMIDMASVNAVHAHMMRQLQAAGRAHRRGVLLPAHARRSTATAASRTPGMMLRHRPALRRWTLSAGADGRRHAARPAGRARPPAASRTWCAAAAPRRSTTTQLAAHARAGAGQRSVHADLAAFADFLLRQRRTRADSVAGCAALMMRAVLGAALALFVLWMVGHRRADGARGAAGVAVRHAARRCTGCASAGCAW